MQTDDPSLNRQSWLDFCPSVDQWNDQFKSKLSKMLKMNKTKKVKVESERER